MTEWISVNDMLPGETVGTVLVVWEREFIGQGMPKSPDQIIQIGMHDSETGKWSDAWYDKEFSDIEEGGETGGEVSFWMPMTDLYDTIPGRTK